MKKTAAMILGAALLGVGTSVFAEWNIDQFIDISLKKHSISDTFDISLLKQDEDGKYLAISGMNGDDYDTVIDLSKILKKYHIRVDEKDDIEDYDGSGLAEYFADCFLDTQHHVYRYVITDENGERNHMSISDDEYHYVDIGDSADEWENDIGKALEVVNDSDISEIYDAYSVDWYVSIKYGDNSRRNVRRYSGIYIDTDKGEFVVFYSNGVAEKFAEDFAKAETMKLYTVREFLDIVEKNYDEAGVDTNVIMVEDEAGDVDEVTVVKKPVDYKEKEDPEEPEKKHEEIEDEQDKANENDEPEEADKKSEDNEKETDEPEEKNESDKPKKTEIDVLLYGDKLSFIDQKPIIENERVLVPFRVIFEALGADALWNGDTKTVTATKGDITLSLTIGEKAIVKNGEKVEIDVPAQIINERTLVPIRVISESFENAVSWDGANRVVEIK